MYTSCLIPSFHTLIITSEVRLSDWLAEMKMGQERTRSLSAPAVVLSLLPWCYKHNTHTRCFFSHSSFCLVSFLHTPLTAQCHSLFVVVYIALLSLFISLSAYQHSYLPVGRFLSVSSIYPSFPPTHSSFLPPLPLPCFDLPLPSYCQCVCECVSSGHLPFIITS